MSNIVQNQLLPKSKTMFIFYFVNNIFIVFLYYYNKSHEKLGILKKK